MQDYLYMLHHDVMETPFSVKTKTVVAVDLNKVFVTASQIVVLLSAADFGIRGGMLKYITAFLQHGTFILGWATTPARTSLSIFRYHRAPSRFPEFQICLCLTCSSSYPTYPPCALNLFRYHLCMGVPWERGPTRTNSSRRAGRHSRVLPQRRHEDKPR